MAGELSASVRGLKRGETFGAGAREDDNLNALAGSLDRLEDACDEALASIGLGEVTEADRDDGGSDWDRYQRLKADYLRRLHQEESFVASGGEKKRAEPVELELRSLNDLDRELAELERCQSETCRAVASAPKFSLAEIQSCLRDVAAQEQKVSALEKETTRLSRIARRIAPVGADMREWTLPKLRACADVLAPQEKEFTAVLDWIYQAKIQLATKKQIIKGLESACKDAESKLSMFRLTLARCVQKAQKLNVSSMDTALSAFVHLSTAMPAEEMHRLDVATVRCEIVLMCGRNFQRLKEELQIARSIQPQCPELDLSSVNVTEQVPSFMRTGTHKILVGEGRSVIAPARVEFPLPSVVSYASRAELSGLLLRLAYALPQGLLQVKVIDLETYGASVQAVSRLATLGDLEIVSEAADVDGVLHDVESYAADLVREGKFSGAIRDWAAYNRTHPEDLLPYRVLALTSCGSLTEDQAASLKRIMRRGREIGVCVLRPKGDGVQFAAEPWMAPGTREDALPNGKALDGLMDVLGEARQLAQSTEPKKKKNFDDIVSAGQDIWSQSAADEIVTALGLDESNASVELNLGGENNHVLLGGTTGSGKSNLIHVMLRSLCTRYSPDELRLYLLDYKDGLEFGKYVTGNKAWLPHVESVSVHNDPAYALSMLDYIQRECINRKRQFSGARNYAEFRRNGGKMPRIVIVIDEFHRLFETSDAEIMSARIMQVLKQGRAYGVHLILATQTLASTDIPNLAGMLGQIPVRLALRGSEDDRILDPDNLAATNIAIPKCVYNDQFGRKNGNRLFNVPEAIFDGQFQENIERSLSKSAMRGMGLVFSGLQLPEKSNNFPAIGNGLSGDAELSLTIGQENVFCGKPVVTRFDDSPTAHLLVATPSDDAPMDDSGQLYRNDVMRALRGEILHGLERRTDVAVLAYNPCGEFEWRTGVRRWAICSSKATEDELRQAMQALADSSARHRFMIVENFERARHLHATENANYFSAPADGIESAWRTFMKAFSGGNGRIPFHVILAVRNFRYAAQSALYDSGTGANLLKMVSNRISVGLPLDDVQTLFPSCLSRNVAGKVLFGTTQSDEVKSFLPYAIEEK